MEAMEALMDLDTSEGPRRVEPTRGGRRPAPSEVEAMYSLLEASGDPEAPLELRRWLELAEGWYITRTLRAVRGNRSEAARKLGIGRRTLYAKMQKLGIEPSWQLGERR
jgi:DNA-binding NtrC family response regulator